VTHHVLDGLPERGKEPHSARVLVGWIEQAQSSTNVAAGRLGWIVASSVVIAALQRADHHDGHPRFLLKGGAYLEVRLGLVARATKDIDTLVRGDFGDFLDALDGALGESWGPIEFRRTEVEIVENARRVVKPRRFKVQLLLKGAIWRTIQVEASPDEGSAGANVDLLPAPSLDHFGLPSPMQFAGIVIDYQVAQKLHACTDTHDPPGMVNDRARDLVDLLLIRDALYGPDVELTSLRAACEDLFAARAAELEAQALAPRHWPPVAAAHLHWASDYERAARDCEVQLGLAEAAEVVNAWIAEIAAAR
jgi:hypothetical protein